MALVPIIPSIMATGYSVAVKGDAPASIYPVIIPGKLTTPIEAIVLNKGYGIL